MNTLKSINLIWSFLTPNKKTAFSLLIILSLISSFFESVSIAIIFPYLSLLESPKEFVSSKIYRSIFDINVSVSDEVIVIQATYFLIAFVLIALLIRISNEWLTARFSSVLCAEVTSCVLENSIFSPMDSHKKENSATIISAIIDYSTILMQTLRQISNLISRTFLAFFLLLILLTMEPANAVLYFICHFLLWLLYPFFSPRLLKNSQLIAANVNKQTKLIQETLDNSFFFIMQNKLNLQINVFRRLSLTRRLLESKNQLYSVIPNIIFENITIIIFSLYLFSYNSSGGSIARILPSLTGFIIIFQRLIPTINQVANSFLKISSRAESINRLIKLGNRNKTPSLDCLEPVVLQPTSICIQNVSFWYQSGFPVLRNINLDISPGDFRYWNNWWIWFRKVYSY